jgi:biopolymer transport protein ExbD
LIAASAAAAAVAADCSPACPAGTTPRRCRVPTKHAERRPSSNRCTMTVRFACPQCGKKLRAEDHQRGSRYRCAGCGAEGRVPGGDEGPASSAAAVRPGSPAPQQEPEEPPVQFVRRARDEGQMDMTPMVDVTFLLLIFFMVTATFSQQKSQHYPPPGARSEVAQQLTPDVPPDDDALIVSIDRDSYVWFNDREAPTRHELLSRIREAYREGGPAPGRIIMEVHLRARNETVVMVKDVLNIVRNEFALPVETIEEELVGDLEP